MKKDLRKILCSTLMFLVATLVVPAFAELAAPTFDEEESVASDMENLAKNIGSMDEEISAEKKLFIEENMNLTDAEAIAFWPVYDSYQKELHKITTRLARIIDIYSLEYKKGVLSSKTAKKLLNEYLAIELAEVNLKQSYVRKFGKAIPVIKVARYIQIETKIHAVLYYEIAGKIPLVK
jgi:hypothetical protein